MCVCNIMRKVWSHLSLSKLLNPGRMCLKLELRSSLGWLLVRLMDPFSLRLRKPWWRTTVSETASELVLLRDLNRNWQQDKKKTQSHQDKQPVLHGCDEEVKGNKSGKFFCETTTSAPSILLVCETFLHTVLFLICFLILLGFISSNICNQSLWSTSLSPW